MDFTHVFQSGRAVDLVLAVMAVEALWLIAGRKRPVVDVLLALLPGALILMAVRAALVGEPWWQVALWLALSAPAHAADLARRRW